MFAHRSVEADAAKRLLSLRQGQRSVADYSIEFRILGKESKWDDHALRGVFVHGLSESMKDELTFHDDPSFLDDLISLSVHLDNRQRERRREKVNRAPQSSTTTNQSSTGGLTTIGHAFGRRPRGAYAGGPGSSQWC